MTNVGTTQTEGKALGNGHEDHIYATETTANSEGTAQARLQPPNWSALDLKSTIRSGAQSSHNGKEEPDIHSAGATTKAVPDRELIISSAEFIKDFLPPDYLIDGLMQRGFLYSFTGSTGSGKTAIGLRMSAHVALGLPLGDYAVERGRVLYFVGENADDVRMRWIALAEDMGFDADTIGVHFIVGADKQIAAIREQIEKAVLEIGGVALIEIDTSAAYFNCDECDDENDNVQAGKHARMFRSLTTLPGKPTVLVLTHPAKLVKRKDDLLPRGGGAFTNEVDGNFIAWKDDDLTEFHWRAKLRGPEFDPIAFELAPVTAERLKDSKGRPIVTVLAVPLTEEGRAAVKAAQSLDDYSILRYMAQAPKSSLMQIAKALAWTNNKGEVDKRRVQKAMKRLVASKLVAMDAVTKRYKLTKAGEKLAEGSAGEAVFDIRTATW